ncbi:MAG: Hsp20/alpha crystallin family protein [Oligoflexales bacterium]
MTALKVFNRPNRAIFDQFFDDFYKPIHGALRNSEAATNVLEFEEYYLVSLDAAGFRKSEIEIDYADGVLTIIGKRGERKELKDSKAHLLERSNSGFKRSFVINKVNADSIKAKFELGVLEIELPKVEDAKPRKISIVDADIE